MSSSTYVKFQSQQNGNFDQINNRVDFIIPASVGKVALNRSFVQIYANPSAVEADGASGTGVYKVGLAWYNKAKNARVATKVGNVSLVKNAFCTSANKGMIQSVRRVDILKHNMDIFRKNPENVLGESYLDAFSAISRENGNYNTIFNTIQKEGDIASTLHDAPIMIALSDILPFAENDVVDMSKLGDLRVSLELNLANVLPYQVKDTIIAGAEDVDAIAQPAVATDVNQLTLTANFLNIESSPYYVGQKVTHTATVNGAAGTNSKAVITEISRNQTTGKITLKFNRTLFNLTNVGGGASAGTIAINDAASVSVTYPLCELVIKELPQDTPAPEATMLERIDTYELSANGQDSYNTTLDIHGDAEAVWIMPLNKADAKLAIGAISDMEQFRVAINNIDMTDNRPIEVGSALYQDRLVASLKEVGYAVKNLLRYQGNADAQNGFDADRVQVLATPIYKTAGRKNLQLNLDAATGIENFVVFTSRMDTFEM